MKSVVFILLALSFSSLSFAAIPRANMILQRVAENSGSGIYQVEQELQFPNGADVLTLKETWLIQNENNMKVLVTGTKELKDQISFVVQFSGGQRTQNGSSRKLSEEFIEKYFHVRSTEAWTQALMALKVIPPGTNLNKVPKTLKDIDNSPEPFLSLARVGGVISYRFGQPIENDSVLAPSFWFEQDQFVLRKFRLPSQAEVSAERYSIFSRGLSFPRTRQVRWGNNSVTIQTLSVVGKGKDSWNKFAEKIPQKMDGLNNQAAAGLIEDFYKRFR